MRTRVGYAGGSTPAPTYTAMGDHTECLQVDFDPEVTSYEEMLEHFWRSHSPWHPSRGFQYRSVLLVDGPDQRARAEASRARLEEAEERSVQTPLEDLRSFTRAEDYHQKYSLRRHHRLLARLLVVYGDGDAFTDSTAAARLNSWLAGYGDPARVERELPELGLDAAGEAELRGRLQRWSPTKSP